MISEHPLFEIVTTTAGAISIRNKQLNETMHNPVGPWKEANALYIEPSNLKRRLAEPTDQELVVFDVGLGAAANALATLHCHASLDSPRPLRLVSFEKELELLRFALAHANQFDHFQGFESAMECLLTNKRWSGNRVEWILHEGDFLETVGNETTRADLVFYDPYSKNVNSEMWTVDCFQKLRDRCKADAEGGGRVFNYSRATPVRTALLLAGFYVGQGPETGLKDETTQASTRLTDLEKPLSSAWLERWQRSHTKLPVGFQPGDEALVESQLRNHPQFQQA